jgi:hypothetical protein
VTTTQAWAICTVELVHARTVLATQRLTETERLHWQAWIEKLLHIRALCDERGMRSIARTGLDPVGSRHA